MKFKIVILLLLITITLNSTTNKTIIKYSNNPNDFINEIKATIFHQKNKNYIISDDFIINNSWFYEESYSAGGLSNYFMPDGKSELLIQGNNVATLGITDIYAEWLGIPSSNEELEYNFNSKISIAPEIKKWGTNIFIYKKIHKKFWLSIMLPFTQVSTNARLKETNISGQRPNFELLGAGDILYYEEPLNALQAFSHPQMKYGKIDNIKHQKSGLADINLKLGINKIYNDKYYLNTYTQITIPTSDKPTAEYLFEPIIGNSHHSGLGFGLNFSTKFKDLKFLFNFDYLYLFQGTEKRSFDLNNGSWSRYMAATMGKPRTKPDRLINYLTQDFKITPGSYINGRYAIDWQKNKFHFQTGTNLECKTNEKVSLKNGWHKSVAITYYEDGDIGNLKDGDNYNKSYSQAKINKPMVLGTNPDNTFITIKENDLNLNSARILNNLTITPYLNLGLDGKLKNNFFNINSGIFYKISSNNKSIGSIGFWFNITTKL